MADTLVEGAVNNVSQKCALRSQVWTSSLVGYQFYIDGAVDLNYRKTSDGGATWATAVLVRTGTITYFDVWYDRWTPGGVLTGKIHLAWLDSATDDVWYASINTASSDTLDGPRVALDPGTVTFALISGTMDERSCSITRARGGNLYLYWNGNGTANSGFERSVDDGANWTSRTNQSVGITFLGMLLPASTSDTQDVALVGALPTGFPYVQVYDNSADTWGATFAVGTCFADTTYASIAASLRMSDGHIIFVYWGLVNSALADLKMTDCTVDTVGLGGTTMVLKTDIVTDKANSGQCGIFIDQNTGHLYVGYLGNGTWLTNARVLYKKSIDGGTTWGTETQLDANALADQRALWCDLGGTAKPFCPTWHNIDLDDFYINTDNMIRITVAATAPSWFPHHPPEIRLVEAMVPSGSDH